MSRQAALPLVSVPAPPAAYPRRKPIDPPAAPDLRPRLAALLRSEEQEVSITTQSPEILRDLDLLVELDRKSSVTVDMVLAAVDPFLSRRLEPGVGDPKARLQAVARLAAEGIAVRILCAPLRPGLNDGERALRPLFAAAWQAGAWDVIAETPARRSRLARLRNALTGRPTSSPHGNLDVFRRLRLEFGFPRVAAGRG